MKNNTFKFSPVTTSIAILVCLGFLIILASVILKPEKKAIAPEKYVTPVYEPVIPNPIEDNVDYDYDAKG